MRLVQTLVVRDEVDIVGAQIAYHLSTGVDFVIATDHDSRDGTTEILESYARDGHLFRIPESGEVREAAWRTRMARLAATDYGADWVINTDADEFWMPRHGTLKGVLEAVPDDYGVVWALSRHFPPRPDGDESFAERMTIRVSLHAALNDPTSPYRPHLKAAHRGDPKVIVRHGGHSVASPRLRSLPSWHPADVLHFPFRSLEQWERKGVRRARGDKPLGQYVQALLASEEGRAADRYRALLVDRETLIRGLADGSLLVDTRLRDALRALEPAHPWTGAAGAAALDTSVIAESASFRDAELVRLNRHLDALRLRIRSLEESSRGAGMGERLLG
jgi:Glycosyl transferase family 2